MNENNKPKNLNLWSNIKANIFLNENTKQKILNLGSNIKANILCVFSSYFFIKERKESKTLDIFFLMLETKLINTIVTPYSFFIKVLKEGENTTSLLSFKFMDMAKQNTSLINQWPLYWFKTQT